MKVIATLPLIIATTSAIKFINPNDYSDGAVVMGDGGMNLPGAIPPNNPDFPDCEGLGCSSDSLPPQ